MEIGTLTFHYPCLVGSGVGLKQLESRLRTGFEPSLIIRNLLTADEIKQLEPQLRGEVSFDIGACPRPSVETFPALIKHIGNLAKEYSFTPSICYKFGLAGRPGQFDLGTYQKNYDAHLDIIKQHRDIAASYGATIVLENDPRPDYTFGTDLAAPDPQPRWQGKWSATPCFNGTMLSSAKDITDIVSEIKGSKLQLDIEHLAQTVQWGNIFNLQSAKDNILRYKDLDTGRQEILETYGMNLKENNIVFDYSNMSTEEQRFLDRFGYIFRPGQPPVYQNKKTLESELKDIVPVPITSVTPGFQVYHAINEVVNGKKMQVIMSHLPGITTQYIHNDSRRGIIAQMLRPIHKMVWQFMENKNIKDVEIEAHVDDGQKLVYDGPAWEAQAMEARKQLRWNFMRAKGDIADEFSIEPFYLK
jgi:hypothetical protein